MNARSSAVMCTTRPPIWPATATSYSLNPPASTVGPSRPTQRHVGTDRTQQGRPRLPLTVPGTEGRILRLCHQRNEGPRPRAGGPRCDSQRLSIYFAHRMVTGRGGAYPARLQSEMLLREARLPTSTIDDRCTNWKRHPFPLRSLRGRQIGPTCGSQYCDCRSA